MKLRSPLVAMLWELWRLTRTEVAWKLALPIGAALAALAVASAFAPPDNSAKYQDANDNVAALALILIVLPHLVGWRSMTKLNGGQPGFPFYLAYTRPVRTAVIVCLPMAYFTAVQTAIYLVSAIVLRVISGYAFPLLPVAAWLAALSWVGTAASWSTRNRVIQVCGTMYAVVAAYVIAQNRLTAVEIPDTFDWPPRLWPTLFDWPRTDYDVDRADWRGVIRRHRCHGDAAAARRSAGYSPAPPCGGEHSDSRRRIVGVARRFVPCPVSHLVGDARLKCGWT